MKKFPDIFFKPWKNERKSKSVIVIGSGVSGLAAAIRLARRDYKVKVFEANKTFGGKATSIEKEGFFWGFGPSLLTFPEFLDNLFKLCGREPGNYYRYTRIDPVCKYFYPDGTRLTAYADPEKFAKEIEQKTSENGKTVLQHLKNIEKVFEVTKDIFLYKSLHKPGTYFRRDVLKSFFNLPVIGINSTMNESNELKFKDPRIVQLFNRYATYNGSDPYQAPSTLNVIAHAEYNIGGYFLEGGMPDLSKALYKLALELGVEFKFDSLVTRIITENGKATGIEVNGTKFEADVIISNMDVSFTYEKLLPAEPFPGKMLDQPKSTSALIFYWGIKKEFPELDLHNIFFSADYKEEFRHLTNLKSIYTDPTVYIFISKKYQPGHAPEGCENWFTLINVPANTGQNWEKLISEARRNIIQKINSNLNTDIEPLIISELVNSPVTIESATWSHRGAIYGNASNNKYSAFLRHPNFSGKIKNLYFCGGSAHPGGGVPLCLLSAQITDEIID